VGSKDFNDNKEVITSDTSHSSTAEDIALLNGEPFSIKSHWIYKAVGWLGICYSVGQIIWALRVGVFDEIFDDFFVGMFTLNIFLLIFDYHCPGFRTVPDQLG